MADDKNQNASLQQNNAAKELHSPTHNSLNPDFNKQESGAGSGVDQQEGDMNNGESGGIFTRHDKNN